ncbi:HTTM domain-containing protein [Robertkochia marina]|uniref:HTTM domain-containing protein n=1 Tax=Robertkochia marina TaxID=1227945 RepID=A0A4S3LZX0_9FLAO|nr:HTTM domain-containing protein [Robertkochia marina]THD65839.1 HTTM domain-containing protein [Robertkochia marina]TRZ41342.1 HTTM domain-containing protein [Robertkochia marina]
MGIDLNTYFRKQTDVAPLVVFRMFFGVMMFLSVLRFWANGWIEKLYLEPEFHFTYYGFEWVRVPGAYTYLIFLLCALSALGIALGYRYKWSVLLFFLSFTYIELMDKTTYLNHYYFISLLSFLLFFLPAAARFSLDAQRQGKLYLKVPAWNIDAVKLMLGIVYFYAGLAKINSDWLFRAMPLKIWLPSKFDLPLIGDSLLQQEWFNFAMSWAGMIYDLAIPFLLLYKRTRLFAFALVVFFHVFTRVLFPIGMFPYIMIVSALIFFDAGVHHRIMEIVKRIGTALGRKRPTPPLQVIPEYRLPILQEKLIKPLLMVFFVIQLLLPFRYLLYPGELFWTEEGFRFSWRVMLMDKVGYTTFTIVDGKTGKSFEVDNTDFLTSFQEKQMSFQPDFILEYAHYLGDHFKAQGHQNVEVYARSYVALNGRKSTPFVEEDRDLYKEKESFKHKDWIIPFKDEIKGL